MKRSHLFPLSCVAWTLSASTLHATPVAYAFTALTHDSTNATLSASGTLTYDGDTHLETADFQITAPMSYYVFEVHLSAVGTTQIYADGTQAVQFRAPGIDGWPDVPAAFPARRADPFDFQLRGPDLLDGDQLRHGLTLGDLSAPYWNTSYYSDNALVPYWDVADTWDTFAQPYLHGCATGTPLALCPVSSFWYYDYHQYMYAFTDFHEVPVPEPALALFALAALVVVAGALRSGSRARRRGRAVTGGLDSLATPGATLVDDHGRPLRGDVHVRESVRPVVRRDDDRGPRSLENLQSPTSPSAA